MERCSAKKGSDVRWSGRRCALVGLISVLLLLVSVTAIPVAADEPKPDRIHPLLGKMVDEHPNGMLRVIVQGSGANGDLAAAIDGHGGGKKRALGLIGAFVAEMPAQRVRALAKNPAVKWITVDAPMTPTVHTDKLRTVYPLAVNADKVWNGGTRYTGAGVAVAVLDSGINNTGGAAGKDFGKRIVASYNATGGSSLDQYGHGSHVAGIIGNGGAGSGGKYIGVAPQANLINVKVSDDQGIAYVSDVIEGLHWVVANKAKYNIRVVNLSLTSSVAESYLTSPLDGAVEMAWLSGVAVVVAAGNNGADTMLYPPANDPFVITVGASDDNATASIVDDVVPVWSSYGTTQDGFSKPDVLAPGRKIVSNLAVKTSVLARQMPERVIDKHYFRLSGTSMAAPVVSGIAALTFQAHPTWTPDQFKHALMTTAHPLTAAVAGGGEVDALAVVSTASPGYANSGVAFNVDIAAEAGTTTYDSVTWNEGKWSSVTWNAAAWSSVTWNKTDWKAIGFASRYPD